MNFRSPARHLAAAAFIGLACTLSAIPAPASSLADDASPSPVPSATPVPRPLGLQLSTTGSFTFVGQNAGGPGAFGAEAPGFMVGSPLAPNTPYDLFSSAPEVSGNAGVAQMLTTATYRTRAFDFSAGAGLAVVHGSITNAAYWGENLMPTVNPHLGYTALPYTVAFPTHPGEDDGVATRLSILSGGVATADGNLRLRAGWFDLAQTDRFVFAQPPLTNINPAIAYAPAETLSTGVAGTDIWQPLTSALPLHGIDLVAKQGAQSLELTDADLPGLPGEAAHLTMASSVFDRGDGTRLSAQVLHATTSGTPFMATVPFGSDPRFLLYPQGVLPTSVLDGQRQTIAGVRGAFHVLPTMGVDGVVEIGRAWYDSTLAARPGTAAPGGFYHAGLTQTRGSSSASMDFFRMEPRYATMILPYGMPENQWSVAFAWPGQWLKSNYQLIDNSALGVNRQGYRLRYAAAHGPLEAHVEYTDLRQIEPETIATSEQTGFVDGFYLPQQNDAATFGRQKRTALWASWHARPCDVTLDLIDDTLFRPYVARHAEDAVSYEVPQAMLTFARHVSRNVTASAGVGRFALKGTFSEPVDFSERLLFAGMEAVVNPRSSWLVSYRRSVASGISTYPLAPISPSFTGSSLVIEQRLRI